MSTTPMPAVNDPEQLVRLIAAAEDAKATGTRWVHPLDEQRRRDARARNRRARAARRSTRRR